MINIVEECTKIVDKNKLYNETLNTILSNDSLSDCVSCTPYIVLLAVFLITSVIIGGVFVYFYWYSEKDNIRWYLRKNNVCVDFNPITEKANY